MANQNAIKEIERIINKENINCDFKRQSAYVFTQDSKDLEKIRNEVKAVKAIGGEANFIDNLDIKLENIQRSYRIPRSGTI